MILFAYIAVLFPVILFGNATRVEKPKVALAPIGPVGRDLLDWCKEHLSKYVEVEVIVSERTDLPGSAYDPVRKQYLGDAMLSQLSTLKIEANRIVGLVDQDCYTSGLNFVFGQASSKGREAFVALPRLRQSFYKRKEDQELFHRRVLKEIIHELGHTGDLSHCSNPKCVMHFSNMLHDTDVKGSGFCSICLKRLSLGR